MKVVRLNPFSDFCVEDESVAAIGLFDGLHCGHMELVKTALKLAKESRACSALITFDPSPTCVLKGYSEELMTMEEKEARLQKMGVDILYIFSFSKEFAALSPQEFEHRILNKMRLKGLVCGFDFSFGSKGAGTPEMLQKDFQHRFPVYIVDKISDRNQKISSSLIREELKKGDIKTANRHLGYTYFMYGEVIHGKKLGSSIGFPTANLKCDKPVLIKSGVYFGAVSINGKQYKALINYGSNPTVNAEKPALEVHILNFNEDLYGQRICVYFIDFMRDERKFASLDDLRQQLVRDCTSVWDKEAIICE